MTTTINNESNILNFTDAQNKTKQELNFHKTQKPIKIQDYLDNFEAGRLHSIKLTVPRNNA